MPAAPNNLLTVEQRLWQIALAWPGLTSIIRVGNRIRFDQLNVPYPDSAKLNRQVADSVELKLDVPGTGSPDPRAPRTFCIQPDVTTYEFAWTMTGVGKAINDVTQVHAELKAAMMNTSTAGGLVAAGTQLGIPAIVARWEHQMRPGKAGTKERQLVWVMRVTVKG